MFLCSGRVARKRRRVDCSINQKIVRTRPEPSAASTEAGDLFRQ
ncbi:hypothetical protein PGR6_52950 [Pseudomonas sp. GR 6-02]|nr:hypothetical protein PGR6_52950 [Pseudomonas sp. GR 6-02]